MQDLDGSFGFEEYMLAEVDFSETALPEQADEPIVT